MVLDKYNYIFTVHCRILAAINAVELYRFIVNSFKNDEADRL